MEIIQKKPNQKKLLSFSKMLYSKNNKKMKKILLCKLI